MFKDMTLNEFTEKIASSDPVPGGGSVSAAASAIAASLSKMVASLTIGKKKYIDQEATMKEIFEKSENLRNILLDYIDKDSQAFNEVMNAFKAPKETDEEKSKRTTLIQNATKKAAEVPLNIAKISFEIMQLAEVVVEKGNKNAITDGAVAAMMARTGILGALYNVKINLGSIKDEEYVQRLKKEVETIETQTKLLEQKILTKIDF
ncbi:cyclodeaminase/cyclohydrolase family protein [Oceanotoga sp. DSM 15011]|jgi:formiminotetrahydrofolate cyclodeaminase|uniref:Formiminotetrahydrofolate cyclodeaminase n=1 Tax=Oceanotoga teriensis TaxID=515440 RepID=A0AA45HJ69_9BACT|nr:MULTISPECIES: cyclodeaminase/cyclohydrolase family protein [Oceanotoga]PWJ95591.1 formiminotetrahydrofolate cyclodeaminase [Oceanotoga teriensis]UYO99424.1 cyclodeaminase/cyclohydrolase family protein [Oceanotoga sp. DSM 15011]